MHVETLCDACVLAICQASNRDTLQLCSACRRQGDSVRELVLRLCMVRGELVHLNFEPPISDCDEPGKAERFPFWLQCLAALLFVISIGWGLVCLLLYLRSVFPPP